MLMRKTAAVAVLVLGSMGSTAAFAICEPAGCDSDIQIQLRRVAENRRAQEATDAARTERKQALIALEKERLQLRESSHALYLSYDNRVRLDIGAHFDPLIRAANALRQDIDHEISGIERQIFFARHLMGHTSTQVQMALVKEIAIRASLANLQGMIARFQLYTAGVMNEEAGLEIIASEQLK